MNEEESKKWLVENIDYILQIRLEELKDDKEVVISFAARYWDTASNFRKKIFGSAGVVATLLTAFLTAIVAFRGFDLYAWVVLIILIIDLGIVGAAEIWIGSHQRRSAELWFALNQKYASAINAVNSQRIFVASVAPRINSIKLDQLSLLIPYTDVTLGQCRYEIIRQIEEVSKFVHLKYNKEMLIKLYDRQKKFLTDDLISYEKKRKSLREKRNFYLVYP
jgi:hypothetical protein